MGWIVLVDERTMSQVDGAYIFGAPNRSATELALGAPDLLAQSATSEEDFIRGNC